MGAKIDKIKFILLSNSLSKKIRVFPRFCEMDPKVPLLAVCLGTDNNIDLDATTLTRPVIELATVAQHLSLLKIKFFNNGTVITAGDLATIDEVVQLCDQVHYWAVAEWHYVEQQRLCFVKDVDSSSVLCECDALVVVVPLVVHTARPKIIAAATKVLGAMLQHPRTFAVFRVALLEDSAILGSAQFFSAIASALAQHGNNIDLAGHLIHLCVVAASLDIEAFLVADVISRALCAMQAHPLQLSIQREGSALFAALVELPRSDATHMPTAILCVQVGSIVSFVFAAYKAQPQCYEICCSVANLCVSITNYVHNMEALAATDIVPVCSLIAEGNVRSPSVVIAAVTALTRMLSEMDELQRRSFALLCHRIMMKTTGVPVLAACCASLLSIVRAIEGEGPRWQFKLFLTEHQVPQVMCVALDQFGEDAPLFQEVVTAALREMSLPLRWR